MEIFEIMKKTNSNELVFFEEPSVSLRAIVAVNDITLGKAITTCRINKKSTDEAVAEALRIAHYNTYKSALLRRRFGGGGLVLCGDLPTENKDIYLRTLGAFLVRLKEYVVLGEIPQTNIKEMLDFSNVFLGDVVGYDIAYNENKNASAEATAKGMMLGLKAIVRKKFNTESLNGLSFAIQGVGEVGYNLVKLLLEIENVKITVTDTIYDKIKAIQDQSPEIKVVKPDEIYNQQCDIFISSAEDNIITEADAKKLKCKVLTGSANEFLADQNIEKILDEKQILYVPGFVINGGDIIHIDNELNFEEVEYAEQDLQQIYTLISDLLNKAEEQKKSIREIAVESIEKYIKNISTLKTIQIDAR